MNMLRSTANKPTLLALLSLLAAGCSVGSPMMRPVQLHSASASDLVDGEVLMEILVEDIQLGEGPIWLPDEQRFVFADVLGNKLYSWTEAEGTSVYLDPSGATGHAPVYEDGVLGANGLALGPDGELILCQHGDRRIATLTRTDGTPGPFSTVVDRHQGKRFNSPNDLTVAPDGDIYFTDPPYGFLNLAESDPSVARMVFEGELRELPFCGIYRHDAQTGWTTLLNDSMDFPNGVGLSEDGEWLYVNSSNMADPEMMRFSTADGTGGLFYKGPFDEDAAGWFDGMKVHSSGNIFTTGPGGILVISPEGEKLATIAIPDPATNCCFDEDEEYLYITTFAYAARLKLRR
ncbi:MAG: SMP-30/gluconolactonase/LRE family protein [Planctomycetes bacterium]|nr:SMP-30/gluconolactonase/LRE family protein [Planctomycetota bacterium]